MKQGNSETSQKTFTQEKDGAVAILTLSRAHCLDIEGMGRLRALTALIAGVSRQSVAAIKRVVNAGVHLAPPALATLEGEAFAGVFGTDDQRTRMRNFLASEAKDPTRK
jgi:enoyl-CoA hydratase/carnithine racemase